LNGIVIDGSVALAWCFPDEASEYADAVLVALEGRAILVPALWSVEITNAVLMAERRKRVKQPEIRRFVELLDALTVIIDSQSVTESVSNIHPIAREYGFLPTTPPIWMWRSGMRCRWPLSTAHCKKPAGRRGSRYSRATLLESRIIPH